MSLPFPDVLALKLVSYIPGKVTDEIGPLAQFYFNKKFADDLMNL